MSIESSTTATIYEQQQPSASRVVEDPALVVDWSVAIQQANLHRVQRLLRSHPDLLWTPLTAWDPERDASHVISQLKTVQHLGSSLDNLCAIHYALLQYNEPVPGEKSTLAQLQTGNLLWFLIEVCETNYKDAKCLCIHGKMMIAYRVPQSRIWKISLGEIAIIARYISLAFWDISRLHDASWMIKASPLKYPMTSVSLLETLPYLTTCSIYSHLST